ncbi:helix-turn-helix domain-containing protein [Paenibacillus sp. IHBB 10380]|uniref:helix-turn-helix domain-containing protein n=1 Tax=Paenibacillus sp. IHBB 10380 TaxID=1566358 RepID=UPI0013648FDA|nr:helix-turn-helix domain-containing protein [Paenibacillus sp. IHBB 10380]
MRHIVMELGEELLAYRLPTSAFLYTVRGSAQVCLDGSLHAVNRFHVFHGGKGVCLDIVADEMFEYYMILYKARLSLSASQELVRLMERENPFQLQYGFAPLYPVSLMDKVECMLEDWIQLEPLEKLHVKVLFYQFLHELLWQMQRQGVESARPDLVAQAIRYMNERYMEPITLDTIAQLFDCSTRYLSKLFKSRLNDSPIRFLTEVRMNKAARLLMDTEATLQEIAERVGYPDGHALSRSFKKYYDLSPVLFKAQYREGKLVPKLPCSSSGSAIVRPKSRRYIGDDYENHYQYREEGDLPMYRGSRSTSMSATLLLCITLVLSACSTATTSTNAGNAEVAAPSQNAVETQVPEQSTPATTRSYTDSQGHIVDIPLDPQRIVLQGNNMGDLWALGIEPIGIDRRFIADSGDLYQEKNPAEDIGYPTNFEKVLALQPDLTLLSYVLDNEYDKASKISPTVVFDGMLPLKERFPIVADIVGKKAEAERWLAEYDHKAEAMWQQLREQGKVKEGETAVILIYYWNKAMYIMKTGGIADLLYQPLGFKMSPTVEALQPNNGPYIEITEEVMHDQLVGDHLFVLYPSNKDAKNTFNDLLKKPLWSGLPQVKNNKIHFVETKWNYDDANTSDKLLVKFPEIMAE